MKCAVPKCENSKRYRKTGLSFHKFPENEFYRTAWKSALNMSDQDISKSAHVCSEHFGHQHLIKTERGTRLTANAVPAVNLKLMNHPFTKKTLIKPDGIFAVDVSPILETSKTCDDNNIQTLAIETEIKKMTLSQDLACASKDIPAQSMECTTSQTQNKHSDRESPQDIERLSQMRRRYNAKYTCPDPKDAYYKRMELELRCLQKQIKRHNKRMIRMRLQFHRDETKAASDVIQTMRDLNMITGKPKKPFNMHIFGKLLFEH